MTFEEYLERGGEAWFLTGKRAHRMQAMMVSRETSFHNALDVADYTVVDDGVTVILKGRYGEMYATALPSVLSAYMKPDGGALCEADFAAKDALIDVVAREKPNAYCAMRVPPDVCVTVVTAGGNVLHTNLPNASHGDGDYLVCRADERGRPDLSDAWVLNGVAFPEYYDAKM